MFPQKLHNFQYKINTTIFRVNFNQHEQEMFKYFLQFSISIWFSWQSCQTKKPRALYHAWALRYFLLKVSTVLKNNMILLAPSVLILKLLKLSHILFEEILNDLTTGGWGVVDWWVTDWGECRVGIIHNSSSAPPKAGALTLQYVDPQTDHATLRPTQNVHKIFCPPWQLTAVTHWPCDNFLLWHSESKWRDYLST